VNSGRGARSPSTRPGSKSSQVFDAEAVKPQVVSYLLANPGLRMDELGKRLKLPTTKLKPLVKKLVVERMLRARGNTRARQYFAAKGATSAGRRGAKAGRPRRKKT
jgi:predicted transcriptional regulator